MKKTVLENIALPFLILLAAFAAFVATSPNPPPPIYLGITVNKPDSGIVARVMEYEFHATNTNNQLPFNGFIDLDIGYMKVGILSSNWITNIDAVYSNFTFTTNFPISNFPFYGFALWQDCKHSWKSYRILPGGSVMVKSNYIDHFWVSIDITNTNQAGSVQSAYNFESATNSFDYTYSNGQLSYTFHADLPMAVSNMFSNALFTQGVTNLRLATTNGVARGLVDFMNAIPDGVFQKNSNITIGLTYNIYPFSDNYIPIAVRAAYGSGFITTNLGNFTLTN